MKLEEAKKIVIQLCDRQIVELENKIKDCRSAIKIKRESLLLNEKMLLAFEKDKAIWEHSRVHHLLLKDKTK